MESLYNHCRNHKIIWIHKAVCDIEFIQRPMIHNVKVFEQMIELNSKHVTKMLEYVIGKFILFIRH